VMLLHITIVAEDCPIGRSHCITKAKRCKYFGQVRDFGNVIEADCNCMKDSNKRIATEVDKVIRKLKDFKGAL